MTRRKTQRMHKSGWLLVLSGGLLALPLCAGNENFNEFRAAAGPGLESGVLGILEGDPAALETILGSVVHGLFEILEPDGSADS